MPGRSLGWIAQEKVSFKREKSLEDFQVHAGGESVLQKRKIMSGSFLGGVWGCYLDLWYLKRRKKYSRRCLGVALGRSRGINCPPKEKNHLG